MSEATTPITRAALGTKPTDAVDTEKEDASLPPTLPSEPHIPDGGLRAWCTVVGAWLVSCCTFGYMNAYGVYQSYYIERMLPSYSPSAISWIGSVQMLLLLGMGIVAGKLFDLGYFRHVVLAGTVLYVGCIFAQSAAQVDAYYQIFLSQGLGQGIGMGLMYVPMIGVVAHHFKKRRAFAMGLIVMGSSCGGIIFPIMLNNLFARIGYKWTVRAVGFLILGCLAAANFLMTTRLPPAPRKDHPNPASFFKEAHYVIAIVSVFFVFWGVFTYFQLFASYHSSSATLPFYTLSIINAGSMFGRTLPNLIADRTGPTSLLVPCCFVTGAIIFALFGCTYDGAIIVFCIFFGFFSGAYIGLMAPMFANMATNVSEIGARMGLGMTFMGLSGLSGTPIVGALIGSGPDFEWWKGIVFSGVCVLLGSSLFGVVWFLVAKKKGRVWV